MATNPNRIWSSSAPALARAVTETPNLSPSPNSGASVPSRSSCWTVPRTAAWLWTSARSTSSSSRLVVGISSASRARRYAWCLGLIGENHAKVSRRRRQCVEERSPSGSGISKNTCSSAPSTSVATRVARCGASPEQPRTRGRHRARHRRCQLGEDFGVRRARIDEAQPQDHRFDSAFRQGSSQASTASLGRASEPTAERDQDASPNSLLCRHWISAEREVRVGEFALYAPRGPRLTPIPGGIRRRGTQGEPTGRARFRVSAVDSHRRRTR